MKKITRASFLAMFLLHSNPLAVRSQAPVENLRIDGIDLGLPHTKFEEDFGQPVMNTASARELRLQEPVEKVLSGGNRDQYKIMLKKGEFLQVVAEQESIHLSIALFGTDKRRLVEVDSPADTFGKQPLWWIAAQTGEYGIEVSNGNPYGPSGKYKIQIEAIREATSEDQNRVSAQIEYAQGFAVSKRFNEETQLNCLLTLDSALRRWKQLGDTDREKQTLRVIANAKKNLGIIYSGGHGVPANPEKSQKWFGEAKKDWYEEAAKHGDADAQTVLGDFAVAGSLTPQDFKEAASWYYRAAMQEYARAENNLAFLYLTGQGARKNTPTALKWFERAAKQGNATAKRNLGKMYEDGTGVRRNPETARNLYKEAAELGDETAQRLISESTNR